MSVLLWSPTSIEPRDKSECLILMTYTFGPSYEIESGYYDAPAKGFKCQTRFFRLDQTLGWMQQSALFPPDTA